MRASDTAALIRLAHEANAIMSDDTAHASLKRLASCFLRQHPLAAGLAAVERMAREKRAA